MVDPIADYDAASALTRLRLTVQQYARVWGVPRVLVASHGAHSAAGYHVVLIEVRRAYGAPAQPISDELASRCKVYVDAMRKIGGNRNGRNNRD